MTQQSRRTFLNRAALGAGAGWLAANWAAVLEARAVAAEASAGSRPAYTFFDATQAADVEAMTAQILPTDDTPGARELRCVYFIDRALRGFLQASQPVYVDGLKQLQAKVLEQFHESRGFASLPAAQQLQLLTQMEHEPFFIAVRNHTILASFSDPVHGANAGKAGWHLIGFEDTLRFEPPFGYYDADAPAAR